MAEQTLIADKKKLGDLKHVNKILKTKEKTLTYKIRVNPNTEIEIEVGTPETEVKNRVARWHLNHPKIVNGKPVK